MQRGSLHPLWNQQERRVSPPREEAQPSPLQVRSPTDERVQRRLSRYSPVQPRYRPPGPNLSRCCWRERGRASAYCDAHTTFSRPLALHDSSSPHAWQRLPPASRVSKTCDTRAPAHVPRAQPPARPEAPVPSARQSHLPGAPAPARARSS